jgi:predicted PurR-regulated permease PerM
MGFLREIWANKWVKFVALAIGIIALGMLLGRLKSILTALTVAWVLAYICDPIVDFFEAKGASRTTGVVALAVALVLVALAVNLTIIPLAAHELRDLGDNMPDYGAWFTGTLIPNIEATLGVELPRTEYDFRQFFSENEETVNRILGAIRSPISDFVKNTLTGVVGFVTGLLTLVVIPVAWFFLLRDIDTMNGRVVELCPKRHRERFVGFAKEVDEIVSNFLRGQITVALILAVMYSLGLWLIADVPLGLVIGIFAGAASIVPYLGLILGIVPALVLAFLQHQDILHPLLVVAVFGVAQALEGNVITPKIVGEKLGLHPVTVIFALLIWAELAGVFGMLIAIPITAVLQVLVVRAVQRYKQGDFYRGDAG